MDYIGAHLDSIAVRVFPPSERILKLRRAIRSFRCRVIVAAYHMQDLLGLMASTTSVLQRAGLKMRSSQAWYLSQFDPLLDHLSKHLLVTLELARQLT